MKKIALFSQLILSLCCSQMVLADEATQVNYINHIIINNYIERGSEFQVHYELVDPNNEVHKGYIYPGTHTLFFDENHATHLNGLYVMQMYYCGIFTSSCRSYSQSVFIQNNADVIWTLDTHGLSVTKTDL